ncbi:hypothetical protein CRG98_000005, partial [Punica granatum]
MELKKEKLVRFYSDGKKGGRDQSPEVELLSSKYKSSASSMLKPENVLLGARYKLPDTFKPGGGSKVFPEELAPWRKKILDPGSDIVLMWNRIFIFSCLVALFVDPLYFYLPTLEGTTNNFCVKTDYNLRIVVTCFRTLADLFYLLHMFIKFRTAYIAPSSRVFGRGELVMDPKKIAQRYIRSDFFIDLIATLPLPQMVIWFVIPATRSARTDHNNNALALIVLLQYIPRLYLIFPLSSQIIKANGVVTKTAWAGAAYNLLLYLLASHVLGAAWYVISVDRYTSCWKSICRKEKSPTPCLLRYLDCNSFSHSDRQTWADTTNVFNNCNPDNNATTFKYGIFENAVTKNVVSTNFIEKYLYCLWWGLQQL